jgi:hypothetical protein
MSTVALVHRTGIEIASRVVDNRARSLLADHSAGLANHHQATSNKANHGHRAFRRVRGGRL